MKNIFFSGFIAIILLIGCGPGEPEILPILGNKEEVDGKKC